MAVMFSTAGAGKPTEGSSNRPQLGFCLRLLRRPQSGPNDVCRRCFPCSIVSFPALSAFTSIYGLFADRSDVQYKLDSFAGILPIEAMQLLADQMNSPVRTPP
jgi:hypothetical protein